ncbi:MAG: sulfatase-like hydrolase/transferase [Kiritimatiellaeota bacterium]|nr:sulfatase-like hydrolase/transferase [Kiritimatiellota bacterium]
MKKLLATFLTLLCLFPMIGKIEGADFQSLEKTSASAPCKPNVLLIFTDDHGWADLGAQGVDKDIRTPNIDQLVREGVIFKRGYVTAPQCAPSRAGVITGRYQQKFGLEDNGKGPLPLAEKTIAERLKPAGYVTGMSGKWHLDIGGEKGKGKAFRVHKEHMPHAQGFDEYFRGELRQFYASHDLQGHPFADAPHLVTDERCRVVVQTEAALSFLERRAQQPGAPWFLYLAWFAPHVPLEAPEPWFSQMPANLPLKRRQALAMIAAMDDGLGRIRAKLKAMGAEKNTLIFLIGDNGAPLGEVWDGSINLPMKGQKGMLSEGGIRTPFVAAWPGTWPAGTTYDHPVSSLDVAATAVALAGQPHDNLDGVNLMPFITGQNKGAPHETLYWRWSLALVLAGRRSGISVEADPAWRARASAFRCDHAGGREHRAQSLQTEARDRGAPPSQAQRVVRHAPAAGLQRQVRCAPRGPLRRARPHREIRAAAERGQGRAGRHDPRLALPQRHARREEWRARHHARREPRHERPALHHQQRTRFARPHHRKAAHPRQTGRPEYLHLAQQSAA